MKPKTKSLLDKSEFPIYYRSIMSQTKVRAKREIKSTEDINKIHKMIWETIRDMYERSEGGVYIENIGYFCHVIKLSRKWGMNNLTNTPIKPSTNGYPYRHVVLEMEGKRRYYHIFRSILPTLKKKLDKMAGHKRYKLRINEVISYNNCKDKKNIVSLYNKKKK